MTRTARVSSWLRGRKLLFRGMAVAAALSMVFSNAVYAALPADALHVGHTTSVVKDVRGQLGDNERKIIQAEKVFFNENVLTADEAAVIIQFRDGSTLELGPSGMMIIDELVFNPFESESNKVMTLVQGSFRYVSAFVAKNSNVEIITPSGTIGIRGSTVSGFSYADKPAFFHVSKGTATFRNDAGERTVNEGQALASASRDTAPVEPENMPAAVTAQALGHIQQSLESVADAAGTQELTAEQRAADAAANAVPLDLQQQADTEEAETPEALAEALQSTLETPDIPLLTQAAEVGILDGASTQDTPEQQAFLEAAAEAIPDAAAQVEAITSAEQERNEANVQAGTSEVVAGVSENAETADEIGALVQATIGANPDVAEVVATTAVSSSAENEAVDVTDVAQETAEGAVVGATEAGADVATVTQAASSGALAGAVDAGADAALVAASTAEGAVTGAAAAGADISTVTRAASEGAVAGAAAADAEADLSTVIEATTAGAVAGAVSADVDIGEAAQAATEGVTSGAVSAGAAVDEVVEAATAGAVTAASQAGVDQAEISQNVVAAAISTVEAAGGDVVAAIEAATRGAVAAVVATGGDIDAVTEAVIVTATEVAEEAGIDAATVTEAVEAEAAATELAAIESAAGVQEVVITEETTDDDNTDDTEATEEDTEVEVVEPEAENPAQDNASPT